MGDLTSWIDLLLQDIIDSMNPLFRMVPYREKLLWPGLIILFFSLTSILYYYSKQISEWLKYHSFGQRDYIVERLNRMYYNVEPEKVLRFLIMGAVFPGALVLFLFLPNFAAGLFFSIPFFIAGWKAPKPIIDMIYEWRVKKFLDQMVDGLALMSNGMRSGLSILQAVGLVTREMPDPIRREFEQVIKETQVGRSIEEAFNELAKRIQSDDLEMFVTAINILKETGGNMAETFDTISHTIRERVKMERKIETMMRGPYIQGMALLGVPPIMGILMSSSDPEMMKPMLETPEGLLVIGAVAALMVVGFVVIKRIINVEI